MKKGKELTGNRINDHFSLYYLVYILLEFYHFLFSYLFIIDGLSISYVFFIIIPFICISISLFFFLQLQSPMEKRPD